MIAKLHSTDRILLEQAYIQIYTDRIYDEYIYAEGFIQNIKDSVKNTKLRVHLGAGLLHMMFLPASYPIYYALGKAYCDKGEYIKAALCLLPIIPWFGPILKFIGFTAVTFHDWIRKTPSNKTKTNQMLQSICEKIFYFFDKNEQNEIKANLEKVIDNLGKYKVSPERIEKVKAILDSELSQSNQKPQPPELSQVPRPQPPESFSTKYKKPPQVPRPQPPESFSTKYKKPPQVPSNIIQGNFS